MQTIKEFQRISLTRFLEEIDLGKLPWIIKRLTGNDTGLTGSHQVGVYLPRAFFISLLPEIHTTKKHNPHITIDACYFPSQDYTAHNLNAVYYNAKFFPEKGLKKAYDEFRITRWGGRESPVQNPDNTGSICMFVLIRTESGLQALNWVCSSLEEEQLIEDWIGHDIEPGCFEMSEHMQIAGKQLQFPKEWLLHFPSGRDIFTYVAQHTPRTEKPSSAGALLLKRRDFEFQLFKAIEQSFVMPRIQNGFSNVDDFIHLALSVANRRKSRTGTSLELNLESIFKDEKLYFQTQVHTENKKKPDFLFPSKKAYHSSQFPQQNLHMMAAKTCCKDRWRQILNEANKIDQKHLFTLQEGISTNQLKEMADNRVTLVVPKPHITSFPKDWRSSLMTLDAFIQDIKTEQQSIPNIQHWVE